MLILVPVHSWLIKFQNREALMSNSSSCGSTSNSVALTSVELAGDRFSSAAGCKSELGR